jgi:hypothetical protein
MIFNKSKEIVLDCFTHVPYVYDHAKIDHATKFIPNWWKETPAVNVDSEATIKNCPGFIEFYKKGIVIPSWFEMDVDILEQGNPELYRWQASNQDVNTDNSHKPSQFFGFAGESGKNIKITSPWAFRTKEEIYFTWTQPTWNMRDLLCDLTILPATVNYKFQHATEINFFIVNQLQSKKINISPLTPLAILHPLTERKIKIKNHLVSKEEWLRIFGVDRFLFRRNSDDAVKFYNRKKKLQTSIEEKSSCPFKKYFG